MRLMPLLALAFALTACGADGPPTAPKPKTDGITISGEASVGVTMTN
ncbi:MAG: hypothetical protein ACT4OK_02720 [Gemmobacter sp.]